jgi:uncharacterized coiled-coil DUF342 family protein
MFLIFNLIFWVLFGWLADYSFPFGQVLELIIACFKGTIASKINLLQKQLQRKDILYQLDNTEQIKKLNNLESQAWIYQNILGIIAKENTDSHTRIAKTIEALEFKKNEITRELEPRKPAKYRKFDTIQNFARSLVASQAEKDYIYLEKIVNNLVSFAGSRRPSQKIFEELIEKLNIEIVNSASKITPYRLRLAYKIEELIRIISSKIILYTENSPDNLVAQNYVNELNSQINILSEQFNALLGRNQENIDRINKIKRENNNLDETILKLRKTISEKEINITLLNQEIINTKEAISNMHRKADALENAIDRLKHQKQTLQKQQKEELEELQETLNKLRLEISNRDANIASLRHSIQSKQNQLDNQQKQIATLNNQKQDLHQQNDNLIQDNQQKQNEIERLKQQINKLYENNSYSSSYFSSSSRTPSPTPKIETKKKLSIEEYNQIYNKSDYVYVKAYIREGNPVKAHYRKKPKRN